MVHASQHLFTAMCIMVKDMNKIELSLICFRCWSEIQDNQHSLAWIDKECFEILGLWNYKTDLLDFIFPVLYHLYIVCFSHSRLLFFFSQNNWPKLNLIGWDGPWEVLVSCHTVSTTSKITSLKYRNFFTSPLPIGESE